MQRRGFETCACLVWKRGEDQDLTLADTRSWFFDSESRSWMLSCTDRMDEIKGDLCVTVFGKRCSSAVKYPVQMYSLKLCIVVLLWSLPWLYGLELPIYWNKGVVFSAWMGPAGCWSPGAGSSLGSCAEVEGVARFHRTLTLPLPKRWCKVCCFHKKWCEIPLGSR